VTIEPGVGRQRLAVDYLEEQADAITRTDETLSRFVMLSIRLDAEPLVVVAVAVDPALRS